MISLFFYGMTLVFLGGIGVSFTEDSKSGVFFTSILIIGGGLIGVSVINKMAESYNSINQTPQYNESWECVEEMWDYNGMVCITSKGYSNGTIIVNLDSYSSKSPMEMCNGIIIEDLKLDIIIGYYSCRTTKSLHKANQSPRVGD